MSVIILAHGSLGAFDEIIFVSVVVIFIVMMAISWFRSQRLPDETSDNSETTLNEDVIMQDSSDTGHFELK